MGNPRKPPLDLDALAAEYQGQSGPPQPPPSPGWFIPPGGTDVVPEGMIPPMMREQTPDELARALFEEQHPPMGPIDRSAWGALTAGERDPETGLPPRPPTHLQGAERDLAYQAMGQRAQEQLSWPRGPMANPAQEMAASRPHGMQAHFEEFAKDAYHREMVRRQALAEEEQKKKDMWMAAYARGRAQEPPPDPIEEMGKVYTSRPKVGFDSLARGKK